MEDVRTARPTASRRRCRWTPRRPQAQEFVAEWNALLAPFNMVADERLMRQGAMKLYDHIDEWSGDVKPPFSSRVWEFIKAAAPARKPA